MVSTHDRFFARWHRRVTSTTDEHGERGQVRFAPATAPNACGWPRQCWLLLRRCHPRFSVDGPAIPTRRSRHSRLIVRRGNGRLPCFLDDTDRKRWLHHDLAAIRSDLQQQRALGRDNFRAMAEAKAQRFAGIGPLIGRHATSRPWKANLAPFLGLYSHWADGHRGEVVCEDRLPATIPAMSRGELLTDLPLN